MPGRVDLLDINVWLAFAVADHPHHQRARRYWRAESSDEVAFCRVTALGFVRLATNPHVMGGDPLTVQKAWQAYAAFRRLPEVIFVAEPDGCESILERWVMRGDVTARLWTDAYLAAFAKARGSRLVSFDRDFARFDGLDLVVLER